MIATADKLAKTVAALEAARSRRDELMVEMREEGAPLRAIASAAGMTATGVMKVLRRG